MTLTENEKFIIIVGGVVMLSVSGYHLYHQYTEQMKRDAAIAAATYLVDHQGNINIGNNSGNPVGIVGAKVAGQGADTLINIHTGERLHPRSGSVVIK